MMKRTTSAPADVRAGGAGLRSSRDPIAVLAREPSSPGPYRERRRRHSGLQFLKTSDPTGHSCAHAWLFRRPPADHEVQTV